MALVGGIMIGLAVTLLLLFNGRVAGISGIVGKVLLSTTPDKQWRVLFILGLLLGGLILKLIYPAHDYQGFSKSTVLMERRFNPRLNDGISLERFIEIMNELKLSYPKKIDVAVPLNQLCGTRDA